MDEMLRLWGENIRNARQGLGLDTDAFAALLHVRSPTVSRWEAGLMEPHRQTKVRIAEVLHTEPHLLFPLIAVAS